MDEAKLDLAVGTAEAEGVISTRLVKVEQKMHVTSGHYRPAPYMDFYGWYSTAWMGFYDPPMVYQYDHLRNQFVRHAGEQGRLVRHRADRCAGQRHPQGNCRVRKDHDQSDEEGWRADFQQP